MRLQVTILLLLTGLFSIPLQSRPHPADPKLNFEFYGQNVELSIDPSMILSLGELRDHKTVKEFCNSLLASNYRETISQLMEYREKNQLEDWVYYQLIRKTAQQISPKADDYYRYTLYKWLFLYASGYNPTLRLSEKKLLFYVQSDENIYNIPFYLKEGKQFVCINYHDYNNNVSFDQEEFPEVLAPKNSGYRTFSYRINRLPDFRKDSYREKDIAFSYNDQTYHFKVKVNQQINSIFTNYPAVDYGSILNIPLSKETYQTLIPALKNTVRGMKTRDGVDYLMKFTRYAFMFESDLEHFGNEKRLTPEQTLLYDQSDCEDRVALFYCLVKEIYDLPVIIISFPGHVTMAIKFEKSSGKPIIYNGQAYTICEPTPQKIDLPIGQLMPELRKMNFEIVYAYTPSRN